MIDWDKPVKYKSTREQTFKVLCTDAAGDYPVAIQNNLSKEIHMYTLSGKSDSTARLPIINYVERTSKWLNIYSRGAARLYSSEEKARINATSMLTNLLELIYEEDKLVEVKIHAV